MLEQALSKTLVSVIALTKWFVLKTAKERSTTGLVGHRWKHQLSLSLLTPLSSLALDDPPKKL